MESSCSSSSTNSMGDGAFRCGICLDLLYKPVVLACGHISCFWCVHHAMHGLRASYCPICRQKYYHFPSICGSLHLLLSKMEPLAYKLREKEVLEEERGLDCFSPQFADHLFPENTHSGNEKCAEECKQITTTDASCAGCKQLLFRPAVLNCGHVYCESCLSMPVNGPLKCDVCHSIHPGTFPKVCLELDQFLEDQFPKEYSARRTTVHDRISQCQHGGIASSTLHSQDQNVKLYLHAKDEDLCLKANLSNIHVGVGCDLCGMYPIIGKRYRCKDCKEKIGFDVCDACYSTSSKLPGRFNQQHTPDHRLELDDSRLMSRIQMRMGMQQDIPLQPQDFNDDSEEDIV